MAKRLSATQYVKKGEARKDQVAKSVVSSSACEGIKVKAAALKKNSKSA